jgi:signal transduction histidine kinase
MSLDESSVSRVSDEDVRVRLVESFDIDQLRKLDIFQQQVQAASDVCGVPVAVIALVDRTHVHTLSAVGVEPGDSPRSEVLGGRVVDTERSLVVEDASKDTRLESGPPTVRGETVGFYFGLPLMIDNSVAVGTLSLIGFEPGRISARQRAALSSIARQVELQLEYIARKESSVEQSGLAAEVAVSHQVGARRQALTNYLLHDVINAATAVKADADYVRARAVGGPEVTDALDDIAEAVDAMAEMLHSAREILLDPDAVLGSLNRDVDIVGLIEELIELHRPQMSRDGRSVDLVVECSSDRYIGGERKLLREMFEGLFGTTLAATPPDTDITIRLLLPDPQTLEILYCDEGDPMSDTLKRRLHGRDHEPDESDVARDSIEALSLCNMIVEAHGGSMRMDNLATTGRRFRILLPR